MTNTQKVKDSILEILKKELEYQKEGYSQWVMGVSIINHNKSIFSIGLQTMYTARTLIKTSESPYVDGVDIIFTNSNDNVDIEHNYYENTPEFQGGTQLDALRWLRELGEEVYTQIENPYLLKEYMKNLESILKEYDFHNLMDYTISSEAGYNLTDLYKTIIDETILEDVEIFVSEESDGKYMVEVQIGENTYTFSSRAWYIKEDIIYEIRENVLLPLIENKEKENYRINSAYMKEETIPQEPENIKVDEDYGL